MGDGAPCGVGSWMVLRHASAIRQGRMPLLPFLECGLLEVVEEAGAGVFDEVGDFFEAAVAAVVGIGDVGGGFLDAVVGEELDLMAMLVFSVEAVDVVEVVIVGDKDEVEVVEVAVLDLA